MVLQPAALRAQLAGLSKSLPEGENCVVAFRGDFVWEAADTLDVDERTWHVRPCRSSLEIRETLAFRPANAPPLAILTNVGHNEIGSDVLARLFRRRLLDLDTWDPVLRAFGAQRLDARVARESWMAEVLLAGMPGEGYPKVASGTLDATTAWRHAVAQLLGVRAEVVDPVVILGWTLEPTFLTRWATLPDLQRAALVRWVASSAGPAGALALSFVASGHGADALPLGLIGGLLFREGARSTARAAAAVRMERFSTAEALSPAAASSLGRAAEAYLAQLTAAKPRQAVLVRARADQLMSELGAAEEAWNSAWSPLGYEQRLDRFSALLSAALTADDPEQGFKGAAAALEDLIKHDAASANDTQVTRARYALRLARYARLQGAPPVSFHEAVSQYSSDHSWADTARPLLYASEAHRAFGAVCERVAAAVLERRELFTLEFARLASSWFETPSPVGGTVLIEDVVRQVVAPVARHSPVLLLVVDGMSLPVARALTDSLTARAWNILLPGQENPSSPRVTAAIAALPSTTEICRTSLLCGALRRGAAADEVSGFAGNSDLLAASRRGQPPRLFHKADLGPGPTLSPDVSTALADTDVRVVGAVINAVDDHLFKDDSVRPAWSLEYVPVLAALVDAARAAGRVVIMTSDHGHLLDLRLSERGSSASADRYRPGPAAAFGEVVVRGPRLLSESKSLVLAASERVRYSSRKNGYHGGISPQEIVVPILLFAPEGRRLDGYEETSVTPPAWWDVDARVATVATAPPKAQAEAKVKLPLFDQPVPSPTTVVVTPEEPWIGALLGSQVFEEQRRRALRAGVSNDRLRQLLSALASRGGKMTLSACAERLSMPAGRASSLVAAAGQLLNFDGYQTLFLDGDDVVLDVALVKAQFQL